MPPGTCSSPTCGTKTWRGTHDEDDEPPAVSQIRGRGAAVIGSYQSAVTATASLAAEAKGIPFLNPESSSPRLTDRNFAWFFRTGPHDITFTKLFYDMMDDLKQRGRAISRVAILSEDTEFGATATGVEEGFAQRYGYNVVARELYTSQPARRDWERT